MTQARLTFHLFPENTKLYHCFMRESAHCNLIHGKHVRFLTRHIEFTTSMAFDIIDRYATYSRCGCTTNLLITQERTKWLTSVFIFNPCVDSEIDKPSGFTDIYSLKNYVDYRIKMNSIHTGMQFSTLDSLGYSQVQHCTLE